MNFDQYLQDYMTIKRLQGVTPTQKTATALFSPYFNRQYDVNMAGRKMDLAERSQTFNEQKATEGLTWDKQKTIDALALEKWQQQLLMDQAARNDTKATIGNVVGTVGAVGSGVMLKDYMKRPYYWK